MSSRRTFIQSAIGAATVLGGASRPLGMNRKRASDRPNDSTPLPVNTPDVQALSFTIDNGVKVFQLTAEPVKRKIAPWKTIDCWGFNGSCPGPTIQVNQGDRVRLILENHLPESTAIHWHGLEIPYAMDGMPYLSQKPIAPGSRFAYEFTVHQNGTFFYHSHSPMQQMMGMVGLFILHPQQAHAPAVDHDFGVVLQEWAVLPNNTVPNTTNMEWNWLTFNGAVSPMTTPLIVRLGSRVRIRFVNIGMDHHPIHLHGHTFVVTGTEAVTGSQDCRCNDGVRQNSLVKTVASLHRGGRRP
jgi:FtsP/CotA-like multicopper oxidase with cupredoxin domain